MGLATRADAAEIKGFLSDFLGVTVPIAKMRARIDDPNIITTITPGIGYCQLKIRESEKSVKVEALFPRGEDVRKLRPILRKALREVMVRYPAAGAWRVWASFWGPVGADGRPDGGESECLKWQPEWPGSVVYQRPEKNWVIESTMDQVT